MALTELRCGLACAAAACAAIAAAGCGGTSAPGASGPSPAVVTPCPSTAPAAASTVTDPARLVLTAADLAAPAYTIDATASGPAPGAHQYTAAFKGTDKSEYQAVTSRATIGSTAGEARATQVAGAADIAGRPGAKTVAQACDIGDGAVAYTMPPDSTSKLSQAVVLWNDGNVVFELRAGTSKEPGSTEVTDLLKLARTMDARARG